jgi:6-pyruvoyl-tetrahydropterin synthase
MSLTILTSVKATFNGSHVDPESGVLHGHDYELTAGWINTSERYERLRDGVRAVLAPIDHARLPNGIWSAEELGRWLIHELGCDRLQIDRRALGHSVTVCAS